MRDMCMGAPEHPMIVPILFILSGSFNHLGSDLGSSLSEQASNFAKKSPGRTASNWRVSTIPFTEA